MARFLVLFSILFAAIPGYSYKLTSGMLQFRYQPYEFEGASCQHERIRDLPDWKVICENRYYKKEFTVHLVARKYRSSEPVRSMFEVLYWVANYNRAQNTNEHTGTNLYFQLEDDVKAHEIRIGQMVDGSIAELEMKISVSQ